MGNYTNQWIKLKRQKLIDQFGGKCQKCGSTQKLEFAHKETTELNGRGRGRKERYYDVVKNPEKYWLTCPDCHDDYDREKGGAGSARTQKALAARSKRDLHMPRTQE
jgi:hypothetical protein